MEIIFATALAIASTGGAVWALQCLAPEDGEAGMLFIEWPWLIQGLAAPLLIWMLMNVGVSFHFHAFTPAIQAAQFAGDPWFALFLHTVAVGFAVIASYWAAITVVWRLLLATRNVHEESVLEFRAVCFTSCVITALPAGALLYYGGLAQLGFATLMITLPIVGYGSSVLQRPKPRPMYSRAQARLKRGHYSDAEKEILAQLEKSETDFDGWLMLADLHATRFKELDDAEQIILDTCLHPETTPSQISIALHKLADWQIELGRNPEAAARTLKLIEDRLPGTHLAHMAGLRRKSLPSNAQFAADEAGPKPIPVPHVPSMFALTETSGPVTTEVSAAITRAEALAAALSQEPNDSAKREELARLLAEPLGDTANAIEQIELLLGMPQQPEQKRLTWLTLIAGWQLQLLQDEAAANATLERLIREFPSTPQAFAAQRRLNLSRR